MSTIVNACPACWLALAALLAAGPVLGASTKLAIYPLGEADAGASDGAPGAVTTIDVVNGVNLTKTGGTLLYSADTHPTSGSSLSLLFNSVSSSKGGYRGNIVSDLKTNFGITALVKPKAGGADQVIAYNGDASLNGWGITITAGTKYRAKFGGVTQAIIGDVTPQEWTHVALVRDGGVLKGFINGVETLDKPTNAPNTPSGKFSIGINPLLNQEHAFARIDQVRVFTFSPGQFDPATDLQAPPPPVEMPALGSRGLLAVALGIILSSIGFLLLRRRR